MHHPDHPESPDDKNCTCMELLQQILDGDATPEQHAQFKAHMDECMPCYKGYHLELAIKAMLQTKCCGNGAPPDLVEKIKSQISQNTPG
jgi:mycothiol system anti-sigma-R factor